MVDMHSLYLEIQLLLGADIANIIQDIPSLWFGRFGAPFVFFVNA